MAEEINNQIAIFGGGCFWCTEAIFLQLKGVKYVYPGYSGGTLKNPSYEQVSRGNTGHVEVIEIEYNQEEIKFADLLLIFFATHNPTTLNRQGNDVGTQYRSIIFYTSESQKKEAIKFINRLNEENSGKIVTELKPFNKFYPAEDYHRNYYENHKDFPYCQLIINPKMTKLTKEFSALLK